MEIVTKSAQETADLGEKLADSLKHGGVVCLYGELGSGKTTIVQGLARGLGIKRRIVSPTFIFIRQYPVSSLQFAVYSLYHVDLYRIQSLNDAKALGLEEILADLFNIVVIEWPEKIKKILPKKRIEIYFEYLKDNQDTKRQITVEHIN